MTITTEAVQPASVPTRDPVRRSSRRVATYAVAVAVALVAIGAVDWTAHRLTHISMYGLGGQGGMKACMSPVPSHGIDVPTHGLAIGIGGYGVNQPSRVTFTGVTAINATPNMVIDHAFLVPGILLGTADYASMTNMESAYQLENTITPGGQIFSIPKAEQDRLSGDRWNLIVVVRTTDPTRVGKIDGFRVGFDAPWHVGVTDTAHTQIDFDPSGQGCGPI